MTATTVEALESSYVFKGKSHCLQRCHFNQTTIGLLTYQHYDFWVTASTAVGEGAHSRVVTAVPVQEIPASIITLPTTTYRKKVIRHIQYIIILHIYKINSPKFLVIHHLILFSMKV